MLRFFPVIILLSLVSLQSCKKESEKSSVVFWMNQEQSEALGQYYPFLNLMLDTSYIGKLYANEGHVSAPGCGASNAITVEREVYELNEFSFLTIFSPDTSFIFEQEVEFNKEGCSAFNIFSPDSIQ